MEIDLLEEAKKLPFAEKMQLVEDLWDAIAAEAAVRRLSDAQEWTRIRLIPIAVAQLKTC